MDKNKIVTVTLNPSLDETLITNHLNIGYHNHVAGTTHLDASGRGVNVSCALDCLGASTLAIVLLGNEAIGRAYQGLIAEEGFPTRLVRCEGPTRSDTIIVDTGEKTETHIIDEGASCTADDLQNVLSAMVDVAQAGATVVLAGIPPTGAPPDVYAQMTEAAHEAGMRVVVLASGEPLKQALAAQPDMVTLTRLEAESLFNYPVRTHADMIACSNKLQAQGAGRVLMVVEDFTGAVLVDNEAVWTLEINDIMVTGTNSGVVDAMLAGYLSGLEQHLAARDALALGAASLSFAVSQIGNKFGSLSQIQHLLGTIDVVALQSGYDTSLASHISGGSLT